MEGDFRPLPSGIITQWNNSGSQWSPNVTAFIGIDVVIHLAGLCEEAEKYDQKGKGLEGWIRLLIPDRLCLIFIKQLMVSRNNREENKQEKIWVPQKGHLPCLFFPKGPEWTLGYAILFLTLMAFLRGYKFWLTTTNLYTPHQKQTLKMNSKNSRVKWKG